MASIRYSIISILILAQIVTARMGGILHAHRRAHQVHEHHARGPAAVTQVIPGPTVVVYQFNGTIVPMKEVCEGIKNNTFDWPPGSEDTPDCAPYGFTVPAAGPPATASHAGQAPSAVSTTSLVAANQPTNGQPSAANDGSASQGSGKVNGVDSSGLSGFDAKIAMNPNVSKEFPDGQIDCSHFPSDYGAIPVDWVGLSGWSGIQYTTINNNVVSHIDTAVKGNQCKTPGNGAVAYCSYACPAGYQKSQWPSSQGDASMAVSVGGLMCGTDGKLHLTNPQLSKHLCIPGTNQVFIQNKLSASSAFCRTDYPGTESETVPLVVQQNRNSPLTCPDSSTYYKHLGAATTAEYYVNMKGVPVNEACIWGTDGSYRGNWAPLVFGVGMDQSGKTWLSIQSTIQNNPSSYKDLDFSVELQGDFGGAKCFYTNGHYCSGGNGPSNYDPKSCQTTKTAQVPGCTVQLMSGNATYVLTD